MIRVTYVIGLPNGARRTKQTKKTCILTTESKELLINLNNLRQNCRPNKIKLWPEAFLYASPAQRRIDANQNVKRFLSDRRLSNPSNPGISNSLKPPCKSETMETLILFGDNRQRKRSIEINLKGILLMRLKRGKFDTEILLGVYI